MGWRRSWAARGRCCTASTRCAGAAAGGAGSAAARARAGAESLAGAQLLRCPPKDPARPPACRPHRPLPPRPQDEREKAWRIQAVGVAPGSFESRKALPVPWRGLRDEELRWAGGAHAAAAGCCCCAAAAAPLLPRRCCRAAALPLEASAAAGLPCTRAKPAGPWTPPTPPVQRGVRRAGRHLCARQRLHRRQPHAGGRGGHGGKGAGAGVIGRIAAASAHAWHLFTASAGCGGGCGFGAAAGAL